MATPDHLKELIALLCCPITKEALHYVSPEGLTSFTGEFPEGALVTKDGEALYPIREGFPIVVSSERITKSAEVN